MKNTTEYEPHASETHQTDDACGFDNIWRVFREKDLLFDVVHYMINYTEQPSFEDVLHVVLHHLEPLLSDHEISKLLALFVWDSNQATALTSKFVNGWSLRAWRHLTFANSHARLADRDDIDMVWHGDVWKQGSTF